MYTNQNTETEQTYSKFINYLFTQQKNSIWYEYTKANLCFSAYPREPNEIHVRFSNKRYDINSFHFNKISGEMKQDEDDFYNSPNIFKKVFKEDFEKWLLHELQETNEKNDIVLFKNELLDYEPFDFPMESIKESIASGFTTIPDNLTTAEEIHKFLMR